MATSAERDRLSASTKFFYLFGDIGISLCLSAVAFFSAPIRVPRAGEHDLLLFIG